MPVSLTLTLTLALALLFAMQELPKLDFLTYLDQVVLASLVTIVGEAMGVTLIAGSMCRGQRYIQGIPPTNELFYIGLSGECDRYDTVVLVDTIWGISLTVVYILAQLAILLPGYRRFKRAATLFTELSMIGFSTASADADAKREELVEIADELFDATQRSAPKPERRA